MATIKDIRRRIRSVASTQQITRAMEMVAAAKLRRAQERIVSARPYAGKMTDVLQNLASATSSGEIQNPLFAVREVRRRTLVVISSDKGLCGAFNANIFRAAEENLKGVDSVGVDLIPVGRRAASYFGRRGWKGSYAIPDLGDTLDVDKARKLSRHLIQSYTDGTTDCVEFLFTRFITVGSRKIVRESFLPIVPPGVSPRSEESRVVVGGEGPTRDYIFEPNPAAIYDDLLPRYVQTRVLMAMGESLASEQAARLVSMSAATKNAGEMIQALTLIRNKLRQAAITKEISELVGGAEALK
jgi:F-type H+-transporting ATPase subunit gamma